MKERLDVILVNRGLAPSREKAKALIMSGNVFVKQQREDKAGTMFDENADIEIKGEKLPYVSRGGLKLEKAVKVWKPPVKDAVCMDVGSSTGGFTDCMLQNGARLVYAIDVGTNQLAWKLRQDPRVVSMEKTNIRYVTEDDMPEKVDFVSIDVAFISLKKVMPGVHIEVINDILSFMRGYAFEILGLDYSPIKGPEGNIEYLLYMKKCKADSMEACSGIWDEYIEKSGQIVAAATGGGV